MFYLIDYHLIIITVVEKCKELLDKRKMKRKKGIGKRNKNNSNEVPIHVYDYCVHDLAIFHKL